MAHLLAEPRPRPRAVVVVTGGGVGEVATVTGGRAFGELLLGRPHPRPRDDRVVGSVEAVGRVTARVRAVGAAVVVSDVE